MSETLQNGMLEKKLAHYRLSRAEYDRVCELLEREPQGLEWALFSALWSEHCSYKSTRRHLKKFAMKSEKVLESMGENAGVLDLGQGERIAFKMESHNHPSFIEPFQGAATGVGGILRDIFTMGARPIALLDSLCFGNPSAPRMTSLVSGVTHGISFYGNCVGVPTVGGKTQFDDRYNGNILVNAFALGLFRPHEKIVTSRLRGPGNWVVYVGAKTGRDGVHGASMASESFEADSESKRPTVQIGDPFFEKLLIESCLEVFEKELVVAIQDMGAAGLTSSSFEMASKGGMGLSIHLDQVPLRDSSITPEEILLSESQERMLLICEPDRFEEIQKVFAKWNLEAVKIGEVRDEPEVQLFWRGEKLVEIHPDLLTENAPQYDRPYHPWKAKAQRSEEDFDQALNESLNQLVDPMNDRQRLLDLLLHEDHCSREWIYRQYDQRVGGQTVRESGNQLSVVRLPDSGRALGMSVGCRADLMKLDAELGAYDAALMPMLQLSSKGFEPMGMTDCLNFGNPEKIDVMSELVVSIESLARVARIFDAPVISGNVSLYNETMGRGIPATPMIVAVGLKSDVDMPLESFCQEGSLLFLLQFSQVRLKRERSDLTDFTGAIELEELKDWFDSIKQLACLKGVLSTKVVGQGGLIVALAEMTSAGMGAKIESEWLRGTKAVEERMYEVIFEVDRAEAPRFQKKFEELNLTGPCGLLSLLGEVQKETLSIEGLSWSIKEIQHSRRQGWEKHFERLS